jgi:hypothetical protein
MSRVFVAIGLAASLCGCGLFTTGHIGGVATRVTPDDYAERLCANLDLESYPACYSRVIDYLDEPRASELPPGHSTSGPFAVVMEGSTYMGHYSSSPFAASFQVSNGANSCSGSYNVLAGSADAIFDVSCDDGRRGWADIIREQDGRNGIGQLALEDGTRGDIVFGYKPLGRATPYAYAGEARQPR